MIPDALWTAVESSATLRQLLGTPPRMRFYPFGEAPQGTVPPYVTWQIPSATPANYLTQVPDMDEQRVQIDVWASKQETVRVVANEIRLAIQEHAQETNSSMRPRDQITKNFGIMLEFQFFTPR